MKFSEEILSFLDKPNFLILGTHNHDKSIQMTVVWYLYEDEVFKISTTTDRVKFKNIKNDPNVTLLVPDKDDYYKYIQVKGKVKKHTTKGGHDMIDRMAKKYLGEEKYPYDPERKEERVTIFIKPKEFFSYGIE